ncbi:hypothetical protein KSP35_06550 [Aquihabitans sp. G128]|uniref:hypothetical protein n=1 Tax=Aquihabitans sp. G128 TaxID=2849779 RepID=UPI001C213E64|nr:hypothetical protein [Aquihabitans sp. G128]QXC62455.1 hypothetical protein KSP35_06550 [Aquihabitans sp. G128]
MTDPVPGAGALPVRRSYLVDTDRLTAVVVEVDPSREPAALAVLQAGLHEAPEGHRLVFGWDVTTAGLGAWVGDQRVRVKVWPALVDDAGTVTEDDPDDPEADVLWVDFDPIADRTALDDLVRVGRLVVAGPDAGPVPLVVDLDGEAVAEALARIVDA